jgi:hypothetical protein
MPLLGLDSVRRVHKEYGRDGKNKRKDSVIGPGPYGATGHTTDGQTTYERTTETLRSLLLGIDIDIRYRGLVWFKLPLGSLFSP